MGSGDLPRAVGKSSSEDSGGKSWRLKAAFTCALRPKDVEGFAHLPFPLCGIDNDRRFPRDAADCPGDTWYRINSRGCDPVSKIPPRPRTLSRHGIFGAQARVCPGREIIGRGAVTKSAL